jgi:HlyD family secretion protein
MKLSLYFILSIFLLAGCTSDDSAQSLDVLERTPIRKGELSISITATGTVEPVEVVDIGAQIVGRITELGNDITGKRIDYGSVVEEGAILAKIDDRLYVADAKQAEGALKKAKADVKRAQANFYIADLDWKRAQKIGPTKVLSQSAYDTYLSKYNLSSADIASAEASVLQAEANYSRALLNVDFCTIRSPVKGTVVDKRVNIGQTVVSSFNAPSLFLIAKDLTKIQVWVSVNEADVSSLFPGQSVTFTVDAYPEEIFQGKVNKIRLNASMVQNVVSYIVEVDTDNIGGKLLPYLTANVRFEAGSLKDSFIIPTAALRYIPSDSISPKKPLSNPSNKYIYILKNDRVVPLEVTVGLSDGANTAVKGEELAEELEVITGAKIAKDNNKAPINPFVPKIRGVRGGN